MTDTTQGNPPPELTEERFPKGTTLFAEGDPSQELYVLLSGAIKVTKKGRQIAIIDEEGAYFGEMSTLLGTPRTATVHTVEDSSLLVVPPERIPDLFGHTPQLAMRMAQVLARRLAETTELLAEAGEWDST